MEHKLPAAVGWWTGRSFSQTSSVQGLLSSTGTQAVPPVPVLDEVLDEVVDDEVVDDEVVVAPSIPPAPPEPVIGERSSTAMNSHPNTLARRLKNSRATAEVRFI
jgi:hypothetical protein